jgi:hypothetical protein
MYPDSESRENAFQIYARVQKLPFAMSRHNWTDHDLVVVLKVVPRGRYGVAYGFPVRDGAPNAHLSYDSKWKKTMELPNIGSYQWRFIDIPDFRLKELEEEFFQQVAPGYAMSKEKLDEEKAWFELKEEK